MHAQIRQNLRADAVIPQIGFEAQRDIGFDGVLAFILQRIRFDLVDQTDAPSFLAHINDDAFSFLLNHFHRAVQLIAAVAAGRSENVAGAAFRVYAHQNVVFFADLSLDQRDVLHVVHVVFIDDDFEIAAVERRQRSFGHAANERFMLHPIVDQIGDGDDLELMLAGKDFQVRHARHGAVVLHDFTDHARRRQPGQTAQVHRSLGLAGANKNAALARENRKHMPGADNILRFGRGVDGRQNRRGAVRRGNAGGHAVARFDGDGKGRAEARLIVLDHQVELQARGDVFIDGQANQSAPQPGHEIDRFRRDKLRRHAEIALVFPVFIIHENDHLPVADVFDCFRNFTDCHVLSFVYLIKPCSAKKSLSIPRGVCNNFSTYLPRISVSMLTQSPSFFPASVVWTAVCGMILT